jgi:hypothetical protein
MRKIKVGGIDEEDYERRRREGKDSEEDESRRG